MSIPGRDEAAALLLSLHPPAWHLRHSRAVAEVAAWLAACCRGQGIAVDRHLVEAAGLLHDVDKLPLEWPATARRRREHRAVHGEAGADWLTDRGFPELARAVAAHPVTRLADDVWWARWNAAGSLEERLVVYADKRAGQRLESMADRFASWRRRYPPAAGGRQGAWSAAIYERVQTRAAALEAEVCLAAGIRPDEVRRLRWTAAALDRAAAPARTAA